MSEPTTQSTHESWSKAAPSYSSNVGRTSALSAARLTQLAYNLSRISSDSLVLDNGAGTGAVTFAISSRYPSARIVATDISSSMLENISAQQLFNVRTQVLDARNLSQGLEKDLFSHTFNTFMLQTIVEPLEAVREMYSVLAPGGVVGIALWAKRNGPFEIWEQACQSLDPDYKLPAPFDDPEAWRTTEELEIALKEVGFHDISTEEVTMPFEFESIKAFMEFWFEGKNPAPMKCMSNWKGDMNKARKAVESVVREEYGGGKDVKTWAVLGVGRK